MIVHFGTLGTFFTLKKKSLNRKQLPLSYFCLTRWKCKTSFLSITNHWKKRERKKDHLYVFFSSTCSSSAAPPWLATATGELAGAQIFRRSPSPILLYSLLRCSITLHCSALASTAVLLSGLLQSPQTRCSAAKSLQESLQAFFHPDRFCFISWVSQQNVLLFLCAHLLRLKLKNRERGD